MARENSTITVQSNEDYTVLTFTVKDAGAVSLDMRKLSDKVRNYAAVHGMKQRISDAAALSRDQKTGLAATPAEKLAEMTALVQWYESGTEDWRRAGTGGGRQSEETKLRVRLINALTRFQPDKDEAKLRDFAMKLSVKEVQAMLASAQLQPILAAMDAEAVKGIDTEALFAGL